MTTPSSSPSFFGPTIVTDEYARGTSNDDVNLADHVEISSHSSLAASYVSPERDASVVVLDVPQMNSALNGAAASSEAAIPTATQRDDSPTTEAPRPARRDDINEEGDGTLSWQPGGIVGPTLGEVEMELASLFEQFYRRHEAYLHPADMAAGAASDNISGTLLSRNAWCRAAKRAMETPNYDTADFPQSWDMLQDAMMLLQNTTLRHNDDCRVHLALHHRAMCFVAAALDDGSVERCGGAGGGGSGKSFVPLHDRCAYRTSYCAQLMPCVFWTRGTFQRATPSLVGGSSFSAGVAISASMLNDVYRFRVRPRFVNDASPAAPSSEGHQTTVDAFAAHQSIFLHGEVACTTSLWAANKSSLCAARNMRDDDVLWERLYEQEAFLNATREFSDEVLKVPIDARRKRRPVRLTMMPPLLPTADPPTDTPRPPSSVPPSSVEVCHVFRGEKVRATPTSHTLATRKATNQQEEREDDTVDPFAFAPVDDELTINIDGHTLRYWTPLEMLASLWHRCHASSSTHSSRSSTSTQDDPKVMKPCVVLFHGDSLVREMFTRLILHLRYGIRGIASPHLTRRSSSDDVEGNGATFRYPPTHIEVGMFQDMVYRVFASHDEVVLLENAQSSRRHGRPPPRGHHGSQRGAPPRESSRTSGWTMRQYMDELLELHNGGRSEDLPLLHIVFCWDHESQKPRPAGFRRSDVLAELALPKDHIAEGDRAEDDDDRQHQPRHHDAMDPAMLQEVEDDVSFSDYDGTAPSSRNDTAPSPPRHQRIVVPLQVLGFTFWQRTLRAQLLRLLHTSSRGVMRPSGGAEDTTVEDTTHGRHLYIMMPLFDTPAYPSLAHLQPNRWKFRNCSAFQSRSDMATTSGSSEGSKPFVSSIAACLHRRRRGASFHRTNANLSALPELSRGGGGRCLHYNIAKTSQWFTWMRDHLKQLDARADGLSPASAIPSTSPGRLFSTVTMFDKGKAPFAGLPMGDHRHCSCHGRATTELNLRQFYRSTRPEPLLALLSTWFRDTDDRQLNMLLSAAAAAKKKFNATPHPSPPIANPHAIVGRHRTLCGGAVSPAGVAEWFPAVCQRNSEAIYRMQKLRDIPQYAGQGPPIGTEHAHAGQPVFFVAPPRRHAGQAFQYTVATTSPPKMFASFMGNGQHRCRNSGDLYFVQLLLHNLLRRPLQ